MYTNTCGTDNRQIDRFVTFIILPVTIITLYLVISFEEIIKNCDICSLLSKYNIEVAYKDE